jgi:hypothetical protein
MARGWESKSVETQMEESFAPTPERKRVLSPADLQREKKCTELLLSRHHVAEQLAQSTNERYSEMLQRALADLDAQIAKLRPAA